MQKLVRINADIVSELVVDENYGRFRTEPKPEFNWTFGPNRVQQCVNLSALRLEVRAAKGS